MEYLESLKEISSEELLEGLLGYGMIAEKIPQFLTSKNFYEFYLEEQKPTFEKSEKDYVRYESMRNTNIPRPLSIPNPFAYANLCNYLSLKWSNVLSHFEETVRNETYKVSRIHLRKLKDKKHLFEMNYKNHEKDGLPEQNIIIKSRFRVEADISSCFPSIYSHSIPWAFVGKYESKENKNDKDKWYNVLDFYLRNIKNGETNGVLIGPHTSNLFSEIVLTKVDQVLISKGYKYVRNIDDYTCYTKSIEETENFLLDLSSELKKFELRLNEKKTTISSLPKSSVTNWVNRLNNFTIGEEFTDDNKRIFKIKKLKSFLDLAIELMLNENNSAVLNYAIKVVSTKHLGKTALSYYLNQLHHLILLYPYLLLILENEVFEPFNVSKNKIKEISKDTFEIGVEKRFYEACSYSLYWSLKYEFTLEAPIHNSSLTSDDCIFMLLGYLYAKRDKDLASIKSYQEKAIQLKINDFDRYWLFIYECLDKDELEGDFKRIKNSKVTFLKSQFNFN